MIINYWESVFFDDFLKRFLACRFGTKSVQSEILTCRFEYGQEILIKEISTPIIHLSLFKILLAKNSNVLLNFGSKS